MATHRSHSASAGLVVGSWFAPELNIKGWFDPDLIPLTSGTPSQSTAPFATWAVVAALAVSIFTGAATPATAAWVVPTMASQGGSVTVAWKSVV